MSHDHAPTSRRQFLQATGTLAATTLLPKVSLPNVHVQGSDLIQVALIGCGGRGGGAAMNALSTKGATKLVAMADVFKDRLDSCYDNLQKAAPDKVDVPAERRLVGFDAYKQAMDALRPGDVVILTTPPAFRWVHFQYAISKKLNVFMEKPVTVDGPSSRRMLKLGEEASAAGLKVGVGLMSRYAKHLQELYARVRNGELGEIQYMRGYRMHGPSATFESTPKPDGITDLEYQIRRFHSFLWTSGGCFNDYYIHHLDHLCWIKGALPVSAQATGGRHYRINEQGQPLVDQNFDSYSVEYTFADGSKMFFDGRCMNGAMGRFSSYVHGTKGMAIAARANDCGGPSAIYEGQVIDEAKLKWKSAVASNPYQEEWNVLMDCIRNNKPHNEVKHGVEASVVSHMGRMAAHTAQEITYQDVMESDHDFCPGVEKMNYDTPSPLPPDANGRYPVPRPGQLGKREF